MAFDEAEKNMRKKRFRPSKKKQTSGFTPIKLTSDDNPDEIKMSAVILKLIEPYMRTFWGDEGRIKGIIILTIAVWNMSFLPEEEQSAFKQKFVWTFQPEGFTTQSMDSLLHVMETMKQRKMELFPGVRAIVSGYDIKIDGDNLHLNVTSLPFSAKQAHGSSQS